MKLGSLYRNVVKIAMKNDPRDRKDVLRVLGANKKVMRALSGKKKALFDRESTRNPYDDTRILSGDESSEIRSAMVGIDIDASELLLADRLNQKKRRIDLVVSHHPWGRGLAELYKVMSIQTDLLEKLGISNEMARDMMKERIDQVERGLHSRNCMRSVDAARYLGIPFMCIHTAADNMVCTYLQKRFDKARPATVGAVEELLSGIPEYREGAKLGMGPKIISGDRKKKAGRVFVDMTGGTEGSQRIFSRLSQIGIGTIVAMHFSDEHYKEAKKEHMNVVVAGHMASDSLGLNLMLDELTRKEQIEIVPCSGFIRYSRV